MNRPRYGPYGVCEVDNVARMGRSICRIQGQPAETGAICQVVYPGEPLKLMANDFLTMSYTSIGKSFY